MSKIPPLQKPPGYMDPTLPIKKPLPPRKANLPQSFHPPKKRKSCCRKCCCCCLILFAILTMIVISACGITYLWYQPKLPEIGLTSLQFIKLNVTNEESQKGSSLNAQTKVGIELVNRNSKLKIKYGEMEVKLTTMQDTNLGRVVVAGLLQDKKNVAKLSLTLNSGQVLMDDEQTGEMKGANGKNKNDNLRVDADIKTRIGLGYGGWTMAMPQTVVHCGNVSWKHVEEGRPHKCQIKLLTWLND